MVRKKDNQSRILIYQYLFGLKKIEKEFQWSIEPEILDLILFGSEWRKPFETFRNRIGFEWESKVSSRGESVIISRLEIFVPSINYPQFVAGVEIIPTRLVKNDFQSLINLTEKFKKDDSFLMWWEDDARGPDKKPTPLKKKILQELREIKHYRSQDDLTPSDAVITVPEALEFFGFKEDEPLSELLIKKRLRELQLQYHPDKNGGEETPFKQLQQCKNVLQDWLIEEEL